MVSTNTQGFLLLSIPSCTLTGPSVSQSGQLSLECYTLPVPAEGGQPADRDVWLVLRVGSFEMPISPTSPIRKSREKNTYTFTQGDGSTDAGAHVLRLPPPSTVNDQEDLETLEVLFEQYGIVLSETPSGDEKGKATLGSYGSSEHGKLLLVDEEDGHVIGHLDQEFTIKEDTTVNAKGREKDPVIVDLPLEGDPNAEIHVHSVKEDDPILRAAGFLSRGIMYATTALATGMTKAADTYVARSTPAEKPIVFSESTRKNVKRVHKISGQAVNVTSQTIGLIHGYIDKIVDGVTGNKQAPPLPPRSGGLPSPVGSNPPPLPPRPGSRTINTAYGPSAATDGGVYAPPPQAGPSGPQRKPRLLNRLLMSTDLLLTTLENAATKLIDSGTENLSKGLGHKYGPDVGNATSLVGQSARNVGVVYIDVRGVGHRALIRRAGKKVVKGMMGGRQVVFGQEGQEENPSRTTGQLPPVSASGSVPGGVGNYKN